MLWSVGNEVGEPGTDEVNPLLAKLVEFVHRYEPTRPVTSALILPHGRTLEDRVAQVVSSAKLMDVLGANYQEPLYEHVRAAAPETIVCGTESWRYWRNSEQLRHAYDPTNPWYDVARHDYVVGQFIWSGIDYLGESDSWPNRGWSSGLLDSVRLSQARRRVSAERLAQRAPRANRRVRERLGLRRKGVVVGGAAPREPLDLPAVQGATRAPAHPDELRDG